MRGLRMVVNHEVLYFSHQLFPELYNNAPFCALQGEDDDNNMARQCRFRLFYNNYIPPAAHFPLFPFQTLFYIEMNSISKVRDHSRKTLQDYEGSSSIHT
jgi:hypothetical protein